MRVLSRIVGVTMGLPVMLVVFVIVIVIAMAVRVRVQNPIEVFVNV
jgi:hypothetical protein